MTTNILSLRGALLLGVSLLATTAMAQTTAPDAVSADNDDGSEIIVTGQTTRNRALITASADITIATAEDIARKAPKSTADLLELIPGIFVEGTAGAISNNYSVRGLQGGGQRFVQLEEDGMPILYQGGGADFYFSQDLTIDRFEAVKGGSSGVLTVNGAGATINFISRKANFKEMEGIARVTASSFGLKQGDFYLSAPLVTDKLSFSVGGFIKTSPGVRRNPFNYEGYRLKAALEYKFDDGGFVRLTGKIGDVKEAYYAGMPYAFNNGKPGAVAGLNPQRDNVGGSAFANISVPVSTFVEADGFRDFRLSEGVRVKTKQLRLDFEKPLSDSVDIFFRSRYLGQTTDFNGLFPGSGTGNAGLASAVAYLTPGAGSPIAGLLAAGQAAFPTTTRFGIKNIRTGVVTGSDQTGPLNALNGNGFLQQTTLNHDATSGYDFGTNAGARWEYDGGGFKNSLTVGAMYYTVSRFQNQSATSSVVNDVKNNSDIYDIVALDAGNNVIGTLTDNGQTSYGNWGEGIRQRKDKSFSIYANDEIAIGDKLRIDGGIRWESDSATALDGNPIRNGAGVPISQPVQLGLINAAVVPTVGSAWDGTFTTRTKTQRRASWTVGANYLLTPNFSIYARYANGFQTNNVDPITGIVLYEAGLRFQYGRIINATATVFRTNFNDQFYNFIDPVDPTQQTGFQADLRTTGVEINALVRPVDWFAVDFSGVFQKPSLNNLRLNGVPQPTFNGNKPERTPSTLFTITPTFKLPNGMGEVYARYKYVGKIFADSGNGVALPAYGVTSAGFTVDVTPNLQIGASADNIFNVIGLTEGNPRQGQTQNAASGFFYARGIVGPTYTGTVTLKF